MDDEVANAGKTSRANFPWNAAYPPGVPARIETPPYGLLGEISESGVQAVIDSVTEMGNQKNWHPLAARR